MIVLHGELKQFGHEHNIQVPTIRHAIRYLMRIDGFRDAFGKGHYRFVRGDVAIPIDADTMQLPIGMQPLHIIPAPEGAGRGLGMIAAGAAIIAVGVATGGVGFVTAGAMYSFGGSLALGGLSQMFAPEVDTDMNRPDEKQSFLFTGPVNSTKAGGAVPVVYGKKVRVGSVVISSGLENERL